MIRIICGTCGTSQGYKTQADGELTLPAAEERRLVARGVAEYVTRPVFSPAGGADSLVEGVNGGGAGINPPAASPPLEGVESGGSGIPGEELPGGEDTLDIVNGHFTADSLLRLTRTGMEELAADLGVDVSRCRNKSEIAALLVQVEVEAPTEDGGQALPELGAEDPVV